MMTQSIEPMITQITNVAYASPSLRCAGARPTNDISIEFEIRPKLGAL